MVQGKGWLPSISLKLDAFVDKKRTMQTVCSSETLDLTIDENLPVYWSKYIFDTISKNASSGIRALKTIIEKFN